MRRAGQLGHPCSKKAICPRASARSSREASARLRAFRVATNVRQVGLADTGLVDQIDRGPLTREAAASRMAVSGARA